MLPAITTMSSLLLLACFTVAASATGEGNSNQMLQPVVLPETTLADAVPEIQVITITLFEWMYNAEEKVTHLTICAQESLLWEGEVMKTNITLVYWMDEMYQTDIEGVVLGVNQNCSLFSQDDIVYLAPSTTHYHLSLILSNSENNTIQRSGSVSFEMPVQTSTLYCHEKPYTRVSGLTSNQSIIQLDQTCMNHDQNLEDIGVCYLEGEFSSKNLCYTTDESDLQVCLQGSSQATAEQANGRHSIGYLAYEGDTDPAAAHLFLEFADGHKPTEPIEALIWKQGISFVTSCLDTSCLILNFTAGFAQYDVCAVTFDSELPAETSTSSITDLNADAFEYNGSNLLQFDFTNANEEGFYTAYVETKPDKTVTVDCSAVPSNRTCHGYFEENSCEDLIVAVQYATATMVAKGNMIRFPC